MTGLQRELVASHSDDEFLTDAQAARLLKIGSTRFFELQKLPGFPEPIWLGPRGNRHVRQSLIEWALSRAGGSAAVGRTDGITDEDGIAEVLGVSTSFVRKDRAGRRLLPFFRIGDCIRYNIERVVEVLQEQEEGGPTKRARRPNGEGGDPLLNERQAAGCSVSSRRPCRSGARPSATSWTT